MSGSRPLVGLSVPVASHATTLTGFVAEATAEVRRAEELGFDFVLVPEHHSRVPASVPAILAFAGHLLARTSRIAVGTGALLLPLHHPRHLAEFHRFVTHTYGPRFFLGVGVGYDPRDYAQFDLTPEAAKALYQPRLRKLADDLDDRPSWTNGLLVAAWSKLGVRLAAAHADGWLADPIRPVAAIRADAERARATDPDRAVVVMREAWIGDTEDAAAATYHPHVEKVLSYYARKGAGGAAGDGAGGVTRNGVAGRADLDDPLAFVTDAARFADRFDRLVDAVRPDGVCFTLRQPTGPPHAEVMAAMERVADAVRLKAAP